MTKSLELLLHFFFDKQPFQKTHLYTVSLLGYEYNGPSLYAHYLPRLSKPYLTTILPLTLLYSLEGWQKSIYQEHKFRLGAWHLYIMQNMKKHTPKRPSKMFTWQ